jgi:hypothetical protein
MQAFEDRHGPSHRADRDCRQCRAATERGEERAEARALAREADSECRAERAATDSDARFAALVASLSDRRPTAQHVIGAVTDVRPHST